MVENNNGYEIDKENVNADVERVYEMIEEVEDRLGKHRSLRFWLVDRGFLKAFVPYMYKFHQTNSGVDSINIKAKFNGVTLVS